MKHDLSHEKKQNDAVKKLASLVASLCSHAGLKGECSEALDIIASLSADDAEDSKEEAPAVDSKSEEKDLPQDAA